MKAVTICALLLFILQIHFLVIVAYPSSRGKKSLLREKYHVPSTIDQAAIYQEVREEEIIEDAVDDVTSEPSVEPSLGPTAEPSLGPTMNPSVQPSLGPTAGPSVSAGPTVAPTKAPSKVPTTKPSGPSHAPTQAPTLPPNQSNNPPPCITDESQIGYVNGMISATQTLYNCLANVADPYNIPTFYNGTFNGIMIVNTSLQLNNLHDIDAVAGTATLDFYLRLYWQDNRLNMPLFWNKMSSSVKKNGVELTLILTNTSIGLWTPDVRFHDAADLDYIVQTIRINASNVIFWSRHTLITLMQPLLDFKQYPADTQIINIRYGSYAYSQTYFKMNYWADPLTFNTNFNGDYTFTANPIWTYDNSSSNSSTVSPSYYTTYVSSSGFLNSIYRIYVTRQGSGIVIRLVLPITLLLLLSGLTFWANYENRVDSTTTLLLSVSALYIVILSNIPLLGYLTAIDKYVFWMFLLLVIVVALHQTYSTIHEKTELWPLRVFFMRVIEFIGRVFVFPCVIIYYLIEMRSVPLNTKYTMMAVICGASFLIFTRECMGVRKAFYTSLGGLMTKINDKDLKIDQLSKVEIVVFNVWYFNTWNTKLDLIAEYLHKVGDFNDPHRHTIDLRNLYTFSESTFGSNDVTVDGGATRGVGEVMMTTYKSNLNSLRRKAVVGEVEEASGSGGGGTVNPMAQNGSGPGVEEPVAVATPSSPGGVRPVSIVRKVNQNRPFKSNGAGDSGKQHPLDADRSPSKLSGSMRRSIDNVSDSDDEEDGGV